jgi:hypothetical protein
MSILDPPQSISPRITAINPALVNGVSSTSHPTITGVASPLSLVSLYINGTVVATGFADATGAWSIALPAQINGPVNLIARALPASSIFQFSINDPKQPLQNAAGASAVFDMDLEGSLFYTNNTLYADQTTLISAIGGTINGNIITVGGYLNPAAKNVLTNGTFDTDTSGWANVNSITSSIVGGEAVIDYTANGSGAFTQTVSGYSGRAFAFTGTGRRGTNVGNSPSFSGTLTNAALGGNLTGSAAFTGLPVTSTFYISTGSGTTYVGVRGNTGGGTVIVDNLSLVEAMPFPGWNSFATSAAASSQAFSVVVDAVTPATLPTSGQIKVLWQGDTSNTHDYLRIHWASDGSIHLYGLINNASAVCDLNLGTVAVSTRFKVAIAAAQGFNGDATSGYAGSLNGKNSVGLFASNVVMIGVSHMRIGANTSGTSAWDGSYNRVSVVQGRQQNDWLEYNATSSTNLSSAVLFGGDSYIGGASGVVLPDLYETATGKTVYNIGVGGSTLQQQRDNTISRTYLRGLPFVHWDGSNNGMVDIGSQIATAQQIWDWKADGRILWIPSLAVPNPATASSSSPNSNAQYLRNYRDALISAFGAAHVYDPVPKLQSLSTGSTDDQNDVAAGLVPRSVLLDQTANQVHLSSAAMTAIAQDPIFQAKINAL